jgi:hypothetical protein
MNERAHTRTTVCFFPLLVFLAVRSVAEQRADESAIKARLDAQTEKRKADFITELAGDYKYDPLRDVIGSVLDISSRRTIPDLLPCCHVDC